MVICCQLLEGMGILRLVVVGFFRRVAGFGGKVNKCCGVLTLFIGNW